ncbi:MAG: SEC-C metal-binding domain-containing protein [Clostridia bacterium]
MSLYKQWLDLMEGQTDETFEAFWKEYSETETRVYAHILESKEPRLTGKFSELAAKFEADPVIFMGFLDGIQTSLNNPFELDAVTEDTDIDLDIDFEKLYFNMLKADADYLYTLKAWEGIFSEDKIMQIIKDFKRSKIVHKEKEPGRNDPCPCGSGKKYKKCCGANK